LQPSSCWIHGDGSIAIFPESTNRSADALGTGTNSTLATKSETTCSIYSYKLQNTIFSSSIDSITYSSGTLAGGWSKFGRDLPTDAWNDSEIFLFVEFLRVFLPVV